MTSLPRNPLGGPLSEAFNRVDQLWSAPTNVQRNPVLVLNVATWLCKITGSELVGGHNRYYGNEVVRDGSAWPDVADGRVMIPGGTDDTVWALNHAEQLGATPIAAGTIAWVYEHFDTTDATLVRDVELAAGVGDLLMGVIDSAEGTVNAVYSAHAVSNPSIVVLNAIPYGREASTTAIDFLPLAPGSPCIIGTGGLQPILFAWEQMSLTVCAAPMPSESPPVTVPDPLYLASNFA